MDITLNNVPNPLDPVISHHDYPMDESGPGTGHFSTATIVMGADTIIIFLPYGGRINYTNKDNA